MIGYAIYSKAKGGYYNGYGIKDGAAMAHWTEDAVTSAKRFPTLCMARSALSFVEYVMRSTPDLTIHPVTNDYIVEEAI